MIAQYRRGHASIVDLRINETLQIPDWSSPVPPVPILSGRIPIYREMLDESAPVRLESRYIGTGPHLPR